MLYYIIMNNNNEKQKIRKVERGEKGPGEQIDSPNRAEARLVSSRLVLIFSTNIKLVWTGIRV